MKVLFHYDAGEQLRRQLHDLKRQELDVVCCPEGQEEPFDSELTDAEVIWHVLQPITADVIAKAPKLKLIQKIGVGVNTIDLEAAQARDIAVCNMPGTNSNAVAEMALLLMLSVLRRQNLLDDACRSGAWALDSNTKESLGEIRGRRVGLIGFGAVPQILAPILEALGATVAYTSSTPKNVAYPFMQLDDLLQTSDIVSLHIPLTEATTALIDKSRIARMKPGAILINTARGALVDETALFSALESGALGGAGLDVFAEEPIVANNPLLALNNVSVAPHVAWLTNETFARSIDIAVHNSLCISSSQQMKHRVV
ncbi:MAG: 2-hydroxyacid dehydrogenase [Pseudomonadales bacterium]